jgi:hypothetical protein
LVVAPTTQGDVLDGRQSSLRIWLDVMKLQEGALRASLSVVGNEGTLPAITMRDLSLHVPRGIPRRENGCSKLSIRPGTDRARRPRLRYRPKLGPLDLLEEQGEGAVDDRARIAVRDLAPEKGLKAPQLVVALLADRELDAIAVR